MMKITLIPQQAWHCFDMLERVVACGRAGGGGGREEKGTTASLGSL